MYNRACLSRPDIVTTRGPKLENPVKIPCDTESYVPIPSCSFPLPELRKPTTKFFRRALPFQLHPKLNSITHFIIPTPSLLQPATAFKHSFSSTFLSLSPLLTKSLILSCHYPPLCVLQNKPTYYFITTTLPPQKKISRTHASTSIHHFQQRDIPTNPRSCD